MGVFYTLFYVAMMLGPAIAGRLAKRPGPPQSRSISEP